MIFRFIGELNDFLPAERRHRSIAHTLTRRAAVKDIIESLGVPHTEVGAIGVNGTACDFACVLDAGSCARVAVLPNGPGHASALRARIPAPPRFVLDTHLGRLARDLRLLGFDACYRNDRDDATLAAIADTESRVLLTRDRGLLKRSRVVFARFIRADDPFAQLVDVFTHFGLAANIAPFTRCSHCNTPLVAVAKSAIAHRLEPGTRRHYQRFSQCPHCGRLFWRGSHHQAMQRRIDRLLSKVGQVPPRIRY